MYSKQHTDPIFIESEPPFKIDKNNPQLVAKLARANKIGLGEIVRDSEIVHNKKIKSSRIIKRASKIIRH